MSTKPLENATCPICHLKLNMTLTLPCGCKQVCPDCTSHWISFKKPSIQSKIPCPVETCKKEFSLEEIISSLPESEKAKINEFLIKNSSNIKPNNNSQDVLSGENKGLFEKLRNDKNEFFTFFWKFFKAKKCPGCKVLITRDDYDDGCADMECTQCKCKFCWYCLKDDCGKSHGYNDGHGLPVPSGTEMLIMLIIAVGFGFGAFWSLKMVGSWVFSVLA